MKNQKSEHPTILALGIYYEDKKLRVIARRQKSTVAAGFGSVRVHVHIC